jgi:hypothetical protein
MAALPDKNGNDHKKHILDHKKHKNLDESNPLFLSTFFVLLVVRSSFVGQSLYEQISF